MAAPPFTADDVIAWLRQRDGVGRRSDLRAAGCRDSTVRSLTESGRVRPIRRAWVALPAADPLLALAASVGGRVTCLSLARQWGWWVPPNLDAGPHLQMLPGKGAAHTPPGWQGNLHWTRPIVPLAPTVLRATIHDALAHIATCVPLDSALVIWESAARKERLAPAMLQAVRWPGVAARQLAAAVEGLSDSGLETIVAVALRRMGLAVRQQVWIAGRPVDLLVGERLVVQIDGYEFHSDSAQRGRDIAHDAELRLRGYTVLRFSYAQVVHHLARVEETIRHAVAQGLHLARGSHTSR
ncbi:endonuclease domain-containing protein [Microbacterium sp. 179-B 1A2 NHS]|uniref:endonuclease domain-containing protein n=1 Tax=Microbacterium sp. 179-B 1A2 NHS TaxID=3142383 RepID=UPI0039A0D476